MIALLLVAAAFYGTVVGSVVILGLALALAEVWQSGKDWLAQRGNSIGGNYQTFTPVLGDDGKGATPRDSSEKVVDGELVRTLRLSQRGQRISGVEETPGGKTRWRIRGEVNGEFLGGTWEQIKPAAKNNNGSFHLQCDSGNSSRFNGQWIGWVAGKGAQGGGEWRWVRVNDSAAASSPTPQAQTRVT